MEELMSALGDADPLGLRERLLIMYERPRFLSSVDIRDACARIPADTLHVWLAKSFWPLHCVHTEGHKLAPFKRDLNYPWLAYKLSADAETAFWNQFDAMAQEQERHYGTDQQAAKRAGKNKTRHARLAVPLHNLVQKAAGVEPAAWSFDVSVNAAAASVLLSRYMDEVFAKLDLLRSRPGAAPAAAPAAGAASARPPVPGGRSPVSVQSAAVQAVLATNSLSSLLANSDMNAILIICRAVCESQKHPCFRIPDLSQLKAVKALNKPAAELGPLGQRAFKALDLLGLGVASLSTNTGGIKTVYFAKLPQERQQHPLVQQSLTLLRAQAFHCLPQQATESCRHATQPVIQWPDLSDAATAARVQAEQTYLAAQLQPPPAA